MIPNQLQDPCYRFVLIPSKDKRPYEPSWQSLNNYPYNHPKLIRHLVNGGNYGVIGGYGNLIILDFDSIKFYNKVKDKLPTTFKVLSGGRQLPHLYYQTDQANSFKVLDDNKNTLLDAQGNGKQVVGPNCLHSSGKTYRVNQNINMAKISLYELKKILGVPNTPRKLKLPKRQLNAFSGESLSDKIKRLITIQDVLFKLGIDNAHTNPCMCPLGHESESRKCLSYSNPMGLYHCFHCESGGDIFKLIMEAKQCSFGEAINWVVNNFDIINPPSKPHQ